MKIIAIIYSLILLFLLIFDSVWLSINFKLLYKDNLSHLLAENINYFSAIIFYLIYAFGIYFFVIKPNYSQDKISVINIISYGFLFGVICYSTYDLTNQATLKDWPLKITIIDICWGGILTSLTALFSILIIRKI